MSGERVLPTALSALLILAGAACDGKPVAPDGRMPSGGGEPPTIYLPEPERIVLEVESGRVGGPFEVEENPGASGGRCVVLAEIWVTHSELHPAFKTREGGKPVSEKGLAKNPLRRALVPNGMIEIPFEVKKAAAYALQVRAWFSGGCGNSLHFSVDEDLPVDTDGDGTYDERPPHTLTGSTYERWKWFEREGVRFNLAGGPHALRIYPREDGLRIDQVFLGEISPGVEPYVPQGMEEPTVSGEGAR